MKTLATALGLMAGTVVILLGIFRYKRRLMVIIGSIAIVGAVCNYIYFQNFDFDAWQKRSSEEMSRMLMASVIDEIESFNDKHGKYPSKLKELSTTDYWVNTNDPISTKNAEFNYKKSGNGYSLFSSGIDGIPNTKDDIFPDHNSVTNTGWKKSNIKLRIFLLCQAKKIL
ncbi:hypothetical protein [Flavobacterium sp.]|uniref:hypothetical protein n=1 Tax=Flavobacterium sp. TaxID=239 RepID=UPI0025BA7C94|nr:hypothetical protein [Flavobacterium sp.]